MREDTRKAALWAAIAGLAQLAAPLARNEPLYFALTAVGYGLILPVIAVLHVRHSTVRQSGAILGTISGAAVVTIGIAASANASIVVAALFVRGIWWWTIGKMWWETEVLDRRLGIVTLVLAVACFTVILVSLPMGLDMDAAWVPLRLLLGAWLLVLAGHLIRDTMSM